MDDDMKGLQQIQRLLADLSRAEKAQVLQWVVRDLGEAFPGIDTAPDICGGEPRLVRTRIPVRSNNRFPRTRRPEDGAPLR